MSKARNICPDCKVGSMKRGSHKLRVSVGDRVVEGTVTMFPKCEECGYYELGADHLRDIERRAALVVLSDAETVSGAVLKYARKALGLKQEELASQLGYDLATVSRLENDAREPRQVYRLALAGLLAQTLRGETFVLAPDGDPTPATPERISRTG